MHAREPRGTGPVKRTPRQVVCVNKIMQQEVMSQADTSHSPEAPDVDIDRNGEDSPVVQNATQSEALVIDVHMNPSRSTCGMTSALNARRTCVTRCLLMGPRTLVAPLALGSNSQSEVVAEACIWRGRALVTLPERSSRQTQVCITPTQQKIHEEGQVHGCELLEF